MLKGVFYQPKGSTCACGDHEPLRYIAILKFAGNLTGLNMLEGHNRKALDVGCGYGSGLVALKSLGYDVYGLDIDPVNVECAQKLGLTEVETHDIQRDVPFDLRFDLITCVGVIEELKSPLTALRNMSSKLKPSGTLIVITVNKHTEFIRNISHFVKGVRPRKRVFWDRDHINAKNPVEWKRNLAGIPYVKPKLSTNFFMLQFHKRYFFIHLPYFGSSTMILIARD